MSEKQEVARVFVGATGNVNIIVIESGLPIIGLTIPNEDKTTITKDLERLKSGDIPITGSVLEPIACYKMAQRERPIASLYSDGTASTKSAEWANYCV